MVLRGVYDAECAANDGYAVILFFGLFCATSKATDDTNLICMRRSRKRYKRLKQGEFLSKHIEVSYLQNHLTTMTIPVPGTYVIYNVEYSNQDVDLRWGSASVGAPVMGHAYNTDSENMLVGADFS